MSGYFDVLTFSFENMTILEMLFRNYKLVKLQLLNIFRAYQPAMGPVHVGVILTVDLDIITITLKILSRPLLGNYK